MSDSNVAVLPSFDAVVLIVILVVLIVRLVPSVRADFRFRLGG
ncbi:hypothetical protein OG321_41755 [Streptomyces sp. NBC_00424]|nr:hypothetical protein [Streptomyces sp. NBC_00424]MCX5078929.1 hypothetical protein [Streptomyces sp. NBC_00424]